MGVMILVPPEINIDNFSDRISQTVSQTLDSSLELDARETRLDSPLQRNP